MDIRVNKNKKPWQLIAILLVTVVPIVAAYVAFYTGLGVPDDTVNKGTMLRPAADARAWQEQAEGQVPKFGEDSLWRILIPVGSSCDEDCQQNLYITRQVHIRLAAKAARVERYVVNLAGDEGEAWLDTIAPEHPGLKRINLDAATWQKWLSETNAPVDPLQEHYYLMVDPAGFAMMFYTAANDGNQLLDDIKRILRYSPED